MTTHEEKELTPFFAPLRTVEPDAAFGARSRRLILALPGATRRASPFTLFSRRLVVGTAVGILGFGLFLLVAILAPNNQESALRNEKKLLSEARMLEFQIELKEAQYFEESAEAVSVALETLSTPPKTNEGN